MGKRPLLVLSNISFYYIIAFKLNQKVISHSYVCRSARSSGVVDWRVLSPAVDSVSLAHRGI